MIEDVILTTENCRYCLMCRHVCPVGRVTAKESLTPHGWGLIIASEKRGLVDWNDSTIEALYSCADCGTCRAHCVTDQPLPSAIAAARAEVARQDLAPAAAREIHAKLQTWSNPYQEQAPQASAGQAEVALFVGDDANFLAPETVTAVLRLLKALDIEPELIGVGRNNGYLASSLGFPETAADLAQTTLGELARSGASQMLVLTPGDFYAFGQMIDERLGVAWPAEVELKEVTVLLAEALADGKLSFERVQDHEPYAYVDPTHSVRVTTRYDAPRALLAALVGRPPKELYWRRERAHPAGNTALQYTQPHIAHHLVYSRLADAQDTGAQVLITEDPGTLVHLKRHAHRFGLRLQGLYPLLADHLAGG